MSAVQPELFEAPPRHPYYVPPGVLAKRGMVDEVFVERSVVAMCDRPDAEKQLNQAMSDTIEGIRAIDLVCGNNPTEWSSTTRERLWLEHYTVEAILRGLKRRMSGKV